MVRHDAQRGSALLIITILVVILSGLAGAFLTTTWVDRQATEQTSDEIQCRQAASAGLDRVRRILFEIRDAGDPWDETLARTRSAFDRSGYGLGPTPSEDYEQIVGRDRALPPSTATTVEPEAFYGLNHAQGGTLYNVLVADDDDGDDDPLTDANDQVVVYVTVATPVDATDGRPRRILGVYRSAVYYVPPTYTPNHALVVNGNLHMGGSPAVTGRMGSVHANGDLEINGGTGMVISTQGSATGAIAITGSPPEPENGWASESKPVPIPRIDPSEHIEKATFVLDRAGNVYDNTTIPRRLIAAGSWAGFSWDDRTGTWSKRNGTTPPPGAIYVDGNLDINGGGTEAEPWRTTLLVNGSISMEGNPFLVPYLKGVTMMAYGDIRLRGTPKAFPDVNGLIATHEQIDISGNPRFRGSVLAEDAGDAFDLVTTTSRAGMDDFVDVTGNFSLTYDGDLETFLIAGATSVAIRSWERYR